MHYNNFGNSRFVTFLATAALVPIALLTSCGSNSTSKAPANSESNGFIGEFLKRFQKCERDMEIKGNTVTICKWSSNGFTFSSEMKLAPRTETILSDMLTMASMSEYAADLRVMLLPPKDSPAFNMILSYKWNTDQAKYVNLIQLAPRYSELEDDATFLLALVHEAGHMRQYARGHMHPANKLYTECAKISALECDKKFPPAPYNTEHEADDFMMDFADTFQWQSYPFNPMKAVTFFKSSPSSKMHRPSNERAQILADLLTKKGLQNNVASSRIWLERLEAAAALDKEENN